MCSFLGSVECTCFRSYFKETRMRLLDQPRLLPAEHLALDEVLLDQCELGTGDEVLRFYEPGSAFVVLGHACSASEDVYPEACVSLGIPLLRRHSGGGTVLQMPGCLNYSLILRMEGHEGLESITGTNAYVTERVCLALRRIAGDDVRVDGQTDLVLGGRKFCGNAQRRRIRAVLFHGVMLLNADLSLISQVLRHPPRQPLYRNNRRHEEFLMNTGWPAERVRNELCAAWNATEGKRTEYPSGRVGELVRTKYGDREWIFAR